MVNVPSQYRPLVQQMSNETGIPFDVVAAQASAESGFNAHAKSSAGALGWLQFLPSTYDTYAAQAGVSKGTEFNPSDEAKVYSVYMKSLLREEKGNLRNALAAYNAGPGNIQAGLGYADRILGTAGEKGGNVSTTGNPITGALGGLLGGGGISISGLLGNTLGDLRDVFERLGLILFGAALILLGIHMLSTGGGGSSSTTNNYAQPSGDKETGSGKKTASEGDRSPVGRKPGEPFRYAKPVGATKAIEAAAIA